MSPWHRINVPVDKIGEPRPIDPESFRDWYVARYGTLSSNYGERFVRRQTYGEWLRERLDRAVDEGLVTLLDNEIVAVSAGAGDVVLKAVNGQVLRAPKAVLCLGNQKPRPLRQAPHERHVADIWAPRAFDRVIGAEGVLIVGTGATAVDAALELWHRGHSGRTQFQPIWQRLSAVERRRFHRHLRPYWMVHRHRTAPDIADLLKQKRADGPLQILRGELQSVEVVASGLQATIASGGASHRLAVGWLLNCTGPEEDLIRVGDPLITEMLESGLARAGEFGIGFDVDAEGRMIGADGVAHRDIFFVGSLTRSRFGEVTSAPQIRDRAAVVAALLAGEG